MPNWTYNYVTIKGKKDIVLAIRDTLHGEEDNPFDFNRIIPMPESLNVEEGSRKLPAVIHCLYREKKSLMAIFEEDDSRDILSRLSVLHNTPEEFIRMYTQHMETEKDPEALYSDGKCYIHNLKEYGHMTWYDWRCDKWGTKWNSSDAELLNESGTENEYSIEYRFDTAWSMPHSIYERLHELYPEVVIDVTYCYEDEDEEHEITFGGGKC